MNKKIFSVISLCLIMFIIPTGVIADVSNPRAQGAGIIYSQSSYSTDHKVSFGFSVWLDDSENIDGFMQIFDQEDNVIVIGRPTWYPILGIDPVGSETFPPNGWMFGSCQVNGVDGYNFELAFTDYRDPVTAYNDWILVRIYDEVYSTIIYEWYSELQVGNIRISKP